MLDIDGRRGEKAGDGETSLAIPFYCLCEQNCKENTNWSDIDHRWTIDRFQQFAPPFQLYGRQYVSAIDRHYFILLFLSSLLRFIYIYIYFKRGLEYISHEIFPITLTYINLWIYFRCNVHHFRCVLCNGAASICGQRRTGLKGGSDKDFWALNHVTNFPG